MKKIHGRKSELKNWFEQNLKKNPIQILGF